MAENPIPLEPTGLNYGPAMLPQADFPSVPDTPFQAPVSPTPFVKGGGEDIYSKFDAELNKVAKTQNYYQQAAPTPFNAEALLFDKYESTSRGIFSGLFSDYDEKGFIPWRDNEDTYNQDSNFLKEMYRSTKWAMPLFGEGFVSGARQLPDLIAGMYTGDVERIFKTDDYLAREWERATRMGASTMGGTSTFFTNFEISAANMLGTISEMVVEDAILAGITAASGGSATPGTVATAAIKGANVFKNIYNGLKDISKVYDVMKNAETARRFFQIANLARRTGDVAQAINPLRQTSEFAYNMFRGAETGTALGKTVKGFGSFYRDIREVNFALTEAKLEGGFSYLEQKNALTEEYQLANKGMLPEGEIAKGIEENARASGDWTTKSNLAVIYASNRIGFGNMFKGYEPLNKMMAEAADGSILKMINFNKTKEIFEKASTFSLKRAYRQGVGGLANYFKANISEGVQEGIQEMIQGASKDYYTKQYRNPSYGGTNVMLADISAQIGPKILSTEGFQTIASGVLMGGVINVGRAAGSGIQNLAYRVAKPEQYKEFKENREKQLNKYISELNEIYKDPLKFFDPQLMNLSNQAAMSQYMAQAVKNGNKKMFYDIKDQSVYGHLTTLLRSGKADVFRDRLNEMKQLTPEEFQEALGFSIDNPENFNDYIDEKLNQLDHIEKIYNKVSEKLVNPIKINQYKKGTKEYEQAVLDYVAFENAKDQAIFANYSMTRTAERMVDLLGDISKSKVLAKADFLDLSKLTSSVLLKQEMDNLAKEAKEMLKGDAASQKIAKEKLKRLRSLQLWNEAMNPKKLSVDPDGTVITEMSKFPIDYPSLDNPAYENWRREAKLAFEALVETEADIANDSTYRENIDQVFDKIMDYHAMQNESENLREAVNILADPANFLKLYDGHTAQVRELHEKRIKVITDAINNAISITDQNSLVYKLAQELYVEDPENPGSYFAYGPNGFFPVDPSSPEYAEIMQIVDDHNKATQPQPPDVPPAPAPSSSVPPPDNPPVPPTPPAPDKEPSILRIYRRRIGSADNLEDLNKISLDITKNGLKRGLTQQQIDALQVEVMDAVQNLETKNKEESQKGQAYFDELSDVLKKANTHELISAVVLKLMGSYASFMSQDQIDVIENEINRRFLAIANGESLDEEFVDTSEQKYENDIDAAQDSAKLKEIHDKIMAEPAMNTASRNKLLQKIKDKSSTFAEENSTPETFSVNDVFDLSNIDQFDPSAFESQINNIAGEASVTSAPDTTDTQKMEDDLFDDFASCNIIP